MRSIFIMISQIYDWLSKFIIRITPKAYSNYIKQNQLNQWIMQSVNLNQTRNKANRTARQLHKMHLQNIKRHLLLYWTSYKEWEASLVAAAFPILEYPSTEKEARTQCQHWWWWRWWEGEMMWQLDCQSLVNNWHPKTMANQPTDATTT